MSLCWHMNQGCNTGEGDFNSFCCTISPAPKQLPFLLLMIKAAHGIFTEVNVTGWKVKLTTVQILFACGGGNLMGTSIPIQFVPQSDRKGY